MTTPFILMTLACAIMAITICFQWRRIKRQERLNKQQEELISDFKEKGFREIIGYGKVYRRRYKYIIVEDAGGNGPLNDTADRYHDYGYDLDREKSTDRLLVFVKSEEVKG